MDSQNPSILWKKVHLDTKLKLQWFEVPSGIVFENEKFRTFKIVSIFNVKTASCDTVSTMVDYSGFSWNSLVLELKQWAELQAEMKTFVRS